MGDIYRPKVAVGACTTMCDKSIELGGSSKLLQRHKNRGTVGFPKPVAHFGTTILYVEAELDAFYQSVMWRQADASIAKHAGGS